MAAVVGRLEPSVRKTMTRISYILPTKDRPFQLQRALGWLRTFKTQDDELIVVDGGVPNEVAWMDMLADTIIFGQDSSINDALNIGIAHATGEYIKIINDDDRYLPEGMQIVWDKMDNEPEIDVVVAGGIKLHVTQLDQLGRPSYSVTCIPKDTGYGSAPVDALRWGASGVGFFLRRSVFEKVDGFDVDVRMGDMEFVARAIDKGVGVRFCRADTYRHPLTVESLVVQHKEDKFREIKVLRKRYGDYEFGKHEFPAQWDGEWA